MSISDVDIKILWGRAAGRCSKPGCFEDLTRILPAGNYNIGEMAHVIARAAGGPRGVQSGGSDSYDNLILLCPTHHTEIDKAPDGVFPAATLLEWKARHEARIHSAGNNAYFPDLVSLKRAVSLKLIENKSIWSAFGPKSDAADNDPGSNLVSVWTLRKLDTIIPNNKIIINYLDRHTGLLDPAMMQNFMAFKVHAIAFESHQYEKLDSYPLFPLSFAKDFENE